ncbi:MAG: DUF1415 domain-containing protein [Xanthomonadales bacterium]|nr:DUF1415 domain-containing protein [Xanthomonadales bacterium]
MTEERCPFHGDEAVVRATQRWVERAVIGLNLCPFARGVEQQGRIRYRVSDADTPDKLKVDLEHELRFLQQTPPEQVDTTLLVHPDVLDDFLDYNDFLVVADRCLSELGLDGVIQIASFHPRYRFEDSGADDIENYTNRAPYPTLHLLRERSISEAVSRLQNPESIYRRNLQRMRELGIDGWDALWADDPDA